MLVLLLILAGISTDPDAKLSLALAAADGPPPMVPTGPPSVPQPPPTVPAVRSPWPDYYVAHERALRERRPLVVFVGVRPRPIAGAVVGEQGDYQQPGPLLPPDYPPVCIVVAVPSPHGSAMHWKATLPHDATDSDIQRAMRPAPRPPVQVAPVRWQGAAFSGGRSPVC